MRLINLDILKNPINWVIVFLMLVLFAIGADVILSHYSNITRNLNSLAGADSK